MFFDFGTTRVLALLRRAATDLRAQLDPAQPVDGETIATLPLAARRGTR